MRNVWIIPLSLILFLATTLAAHATDRIAVGLFHGAHYLRVSINCTQGSYEIYADDTKIGILTDEHPFEISTISGSVTVYFNQQTTKNIHRIALKPANANAQLHIQPVGAKSNRRQYTQEISVFHYAGRLQLVNHIEIEEYVAGVIEAESGSKQKTEFYKVQAVISRTYAMNNLQKHKTEGFNMCDAVHCQVYHGIPLHEPKTHEAALATRDLVLVDHQINLIDATFHSNCGGLTYKASEVWNKDVHHLQNVEDSFCSQMPHSQWRKTIPRATWDNYIYNQRHPLSSNEASLNSSSLESKPQYFIDSTLQLNRVMMREDLKLRSVKFDVEITPDSVLFFGKGFGHGVGLCQEGAMARANEGIRYQDIIHTYYKDVHLVPRYMIWFFKDEESNGD
jgi:stage II sporulation protein D